MATQLIAFIIALAGMALVALGFVFVISNTQEPTEDKRRKSIVTKGRLQAGLFVILLIGFVVGSWATLHNFPIPPQHEALAADQIVKVVGHQWYWDITPSTLHTNQVVEFQVTSADVNHGFAIYSPAGRVITQTQAMPGYTNKLLYTFRQPGMYTVQCLEYCGLGHVPMRATIRVVAIKGE